MVGSRRKWEEEETLFLFYLFLNECPKHLSLDSPMVIDIANLLNNRSPKAVHYKLENIRTSDPAYLARGGKEMNSAKFIKEVWSDLYEDYEKTVQRINDAYLSICNGQIETSEIQIDPEIPPGIDVPIESTYRDGQQVFRRMVANNFNRRCCITGMSINGLLVASHIKSWASSSPQERTDPGNGLFLNRLHDGLFDNHLMTLDENLCVVFSEAVASGSSQEDYEQFFGRFEGCRIREHAIEIDKDCVDEHRRIAYRKWGVV